ncbi:MAG: HAMP domain-containing methyl-accepting chemotaxis protein [Alkalispirochaeta sp.]
MKMSSLPGIGYFLFPALVGPVSIVAVDWFTHLATTAELLDSLSAVVIGTFLALVVVGAVVFGALFRAFYRQCEDHPVSAYRMLSWIPFSVVLWSALHNVVFSIVLHSGSTFVTDGTGLWIVGLYAGAVGTFFGIFFYAAMVPRMEARLSIGPALAGEVKPPRTDVRFMASVVLTIASFLFGAVSVVLHPIYAGESLIFALIRISLVAIPFLALTVLLTRFLSQVITGPLTRAFSQLHRFTEGDLTERIPVNGVSEVDLTLAGINTFVDTLAEVLGATRTDTNRNVEAASSLNSQAENQRSSSRDVARRLESAATRIGELKEHVESTASATEEITRTLQSLGSQITDQNTAIDETVASAEELSSSTRSVVEVSETRQRAAEELRSVAADSRSHAQNAVKNVESIAAQVGDILSLNSAIAGLAAQTNMLAMNAAIEAAHAGDAGRGFAVVAAEIRSLAESASKNAKESSDFLKRVVGGIEATDQAIRKVETSFQRVDDETGSLTDSLGEIVGAAQEMNTTAAGITSQMENLQSINHRVVEAVTQINEGAEEIDSAGQQSKAITQDVEELLASVQSATNTLTESAEELPAISEAITTRASELQRRLATFQLADDTDPTGTHRRS